MRTTCRHTASRPSPPFQFSLHVLALALSTASAASADTLHVALCGDDSWTGSTPACKAPQGPKRTLQAAIDASVDGDTILVAPGVYTGAGNRDLDFGGRAITLRSASGAANCVLDLEGSIADPHRAFRFHSGEGPTSVVDGFTFQSGFADFGGAMLFEAGSSPTIANCVFDQSTAYPSPAGGEGGAVRSVASSPRFRACHFLRNEAARVAGVGGRGGAMQFLGGAPELLQCTFEENTAGGGGGVHCTNASNPVLVDCTFERNWTADPAFNGGGGYLGSLGGHHTLVNCRFVENQTARVAGALWITQGVAATINKCIFADNYGFDAGGVGVANGSHAVIHDCLFTGNSADIFSSALEVWNGPPTGASSTVALSNCTFADNLATPGYGAIVVTHTSSVSATSCVLWNNAPLSVVLLDSGAASVEHSVVQGGWAGAGNVDADPLFVAHGPRPYSLQPGSPCIDTGDPGFGSPCAHDLIGACRVWDGNGDALARVDMGAYEHGSLLGDLDGDCTVGPADLRLLQAHLHTTSGATPGQGDLDGDGDVDVVDLQQLVWALGSTCP
jgi:predicted outer membrane repeat protein